MFKVLFVAVMVLCGLNLNAQSSEVEDRLALNFISYETSEIDKADQFRNSSQPSNDVGLTIPSPSGKASIQLELFKTSVFSDDYVRTVYHGDSVVTTDGMDLVMMEGRIMDRPETRVFVVSGVNYFFAYVDDGYEKYYYEPISLYGGSVESNTIVIYNEKDVKSTSSKCGSNVYHQQQHGNRNPTTVRAGQCYEVEYAVVSDFRMYQDFGNSVSQVEAFTASITGLMNGDYDTSFDDELVHVIVQNVVSTSEAGDEWLQNGNPASIDELLNEFSAWGPDNLVSHDVASMWTGFDLSGNTIGLAWLGVVCQSFRYNVLEHYTSNTTQLRVLTSHELGHNYNASHDSSGGFIMSPSVNNTSTWSSQSINAINAYYIPRAPSCFDQCGGGGGPDSPTADFTYTINDACAPGEVSFTDASSGDPNTWSWTFEGGNPSTATCRTPNVSYSQAGIYDVTLTVSNSSGTDVLTRSDFIVINDEPVAFFSSEINGLQVTFNDQSQYGTNYLWDFGNGETSTEYNPHVIYEQAGSYLVSLTISNECESDEYTSLIVLESLPVAGVQADKVDLCTGQSVQFSDVSTGNVTSRLWTFEGGSPVNSIDEIVEVQYFMPGAFDMSLSVTNNVGSDEVYVPDYINVSNSAIADFNYNLEGNQVNFINLSSSATTYSWRFGDGYVSTDANPTHIYNEGGVYIVELLAMNHCSEDVKVVSISIEILPEAEIGISGQADICVGNSIQFLDQSSANVDSYFWEFEGGTPETSTDPNPLIQYNERGTFNVSLTVTNEVGSDTQVIGNYINVKPEAEAGFTFEINERLISFTNISMNASSFFWDFGDGTSSTVSNPNHEYEADGTYEVTLNAGSVCGEDSFSETVQIRMAPIADFEIDQNEGCVGDIITVNNLTHGENIDYLWSCDGAVISDQMAENPTFIFNESGTYNISLTATNESGSDTHFIEAAVSILDGVNSDVGYTFNGLNVLFLNNSSAGNNLWDFGDGNLSEETEPGHTYGQEGIYQVIHTITNVCGIDESMIDLNLYTQPEASFEVISGKGCKPLVVKVENNSSINSETFTWVSEGAIVSGDEVNPTFTYEVPGLYSISLIASNPGGEDTLTLVDAVEVIDVPEPEFGFNTTLLKVDFEAVETPDAEYLWDFGDGKEAMGSTVSNTYFEPGTYEVILMMTNECGSNSLSREVVVNELPSADFTVDKDSLCSGNTIQFTNLSSENSMEFHWIFEGGIPASSTEMDPMVTYPVPGVYDVRLIVSGIEGSDTLEQKEYINVYGPPKLTYDVAVEGNMITVVNESEDYDYSAFILGNDTIPGTRIDYAASFNGTFMIVLMAQNDCGTSSDSILTDIEVFPEATLNFDILSECAGTDLTFPEREPREGDEYHWYLIGKDSTYIAEGANPTFNILTKGIYDLKLKVENQYGVDSILSQELIQILNIAPAEIQYDLDGNRVIASDLNSGDYSRSWDMGDGTQLTGANIEYDYETEGIYLMVFTTDNQCGQDTVSIELEVISSGVTQPNFPSLKIYPNPASDQVTIEGFDLIRELSIQLLDYNGKVIRNFRINAEIGTNKLDLSESPAGIYLLRISDGIKADYRKLIIIR